MKYFRPSKVLAGFHADQPDAGVPELVHAGEQWAPSSYLVEPHTHSVWEFYLQVSGESRWESFEEPSRPRRYVLKPGHFFAAAPGVRHGLNERPRKEHHFFFAGIDLAPVFDRHPPLRPLWREQRCIQMPGCDSMQAVFRQLIRELTIRLPLRSEGLRSAMDYVVIEASRFRTAAGQGRANGAATGRPMLPMHPAVQRVRELLDAQFAEPWRLVDLGRITGVSPNHLAQLFTKEVGIAPHQYLLRQRMARAQEMLIQTDVPVTQISMELGFSSSQHFAKMFRSEVGSSAADFRRRSQATATRKQKRG